jgi:hypothetical protein
MDAKGLPNGKRDKIRELIRKHGNASISALRRAYGRYFAPGMPDTEKLADVIHQLDERSIAKLGRESY